MKSVTVTIENAVLARARKAAAREGKSLSRSIAEMLDDRLAPPPASPSAMERFLSGPLMDLTDADGRAPSRDRIYERRLR